MDVLPKQTKQHLRKDAISGNRIQAAVRWILRSGIQNPPGTLDIHGVDLSGSFNAWFNVETGRYSYVYSEITGYALTCLIYLYTITGEQIFLERAHSAGKWLSATQRRDGSFPTALRSEVEKKFDDCTFDAGVVVNGLVSLYKTTQKEEYLAVARKAADWLIRFQKSDGSVAAHVAKDGSVSDTPATWSTQSGSYHAKIGIGLLNLFSVLQEESYRDAARGLCDYALTFQEDSGQFYTYGEKHGSNMHPHFYSAEGLYVAGIFFNEKKYTNAAKRAAEWALSYTKEGIIPRNRHEACNYNERVDILAQGYRLFQLFGFHGSIAAQAVKQKIVSYQYTGKVEEQRGGFLFGKQSDGAPAPHVNCWVTFFALQALLIEERGTLEDSFLIV